MKIIELLEMLSGCDPESEVKVSPACLMRYAGTVGDGGHIDLNSPETVVMPDTSRSAPVEDILLLAKIGEKPIVHILFVPPDRTENEQEFIN